MSDKKVILILSGQAQLEGGPAVEKFAKKAARANAYQGGDLKALVEANGQAVFAAPEEIKDQFDKGAAFVCVESSDDEAAMAAAAAAMDRRTLIIWVGSESARFGGFGTKKGGETDRDVFARDIRPTINYLADVPLTDDVDGAIIYQVLKDVNLKAKEISRLNDAVARMEAAMERAEGHDPWKKHDCS